MGTHLGEASVHELVPQKQAEDAIRQEFEQTLSGRAVRYLQVKPHGIIPYKHFSVASTECSLLFRDGHFYGCIAVTQAVAEAIVRFLSETNFKNHENVFEKNVKTLSKRGFISDKLKESFLEVWKMRDDYHHLNSNVETDRQALEELARKKTRLLAEIESEIFHFTVVDDGKIIPEQPKYWKASGNQVEVFLRLKP